MLETAKGDVLDELRALCGEDTIALLGAVLALAVDVAVVAGEVLPGALVDCVRLFAGDAAFDALLVDEAGSAAGHIRRRKHHQGGAQKRKSLLDTSRQMVSNASRYITMRWLTLQRTVSGQTAALQLFHRPNVAALRWRDRLGSSPL